VGQTTTPVATPAESQRPHEYDGGWQMP
jgi:hypothetical protein